MASRAKKTGGRGRGRKIAAPRPAEPALLVGVGASAGGLQALQEFLGAVPAECGFAILVVTHQDPRHTSLLPELLGKYSALPVATATDGGRVLPNRVYVTPPGARVAVFERAIQIMGGADLHDAPLPIDYFFRSLADDAGVRSAGIVLSGTGTDGTLGLAAIRDAGGFTAAQDPATALFPGMPENAVDKGVAQWVRPPSELPECLQLHARRSVTGGHGPGTEAEAAGDGGAGTDVGHTLERICILLRKRTGHDFSTHKPSTLRRRIERRMTLHGIRTEAGYAQCLADNPQEIDLLFRDLLIGVTSFFRDRSVFEHLAKTTLPGLLAGKPDGATVRAWIPGCSTGEEAYSIAIVLRECALALDRQVNLQLFATDLDRHAIEIARAGFYPEDIAAAVGPRRLERFFTREDHGYRIGKDVRQSLVFAPHDLVADPPFTRLDFISCRNVLIYLTAPAQKRLLPLFHYSLDPEGLLLLGPSESAGGFEHLFRPVDKKSKLFARRAAPIELRDAVGGPSGRPAGDAAPGAAPPRPAEAQRTASATVGFEHALAARFIPPSAIVNERGDILFVHGQTGAFLETPPGKPSLNVLRMAREGLGNALGTALRKAATTDAIVTRRGVRIVTDGGPRRVTVAVNRILQPETLAGLFVVAFTPEDDAKAAGSAADTGPGSPLEPEGVDQLQRDLDETRTTLQATIEQLESTNEDLTSANEELQSINEELQSANEELETSKEEMQSLNEELQTVNSELQSKINELSQTSDDMKNLLNSTQIATIFLNTKLDIVRFTPHAKRVIKLIDTDVGRPLSDLVSMLHYERLEADARSVLDTLVPIEREVESVDAAHFAVRIMPYRTSENIINGLVITFTDVSLVRGPPAAATTPVRRKPSGAVPAPPKGRKGRR